MLSQVAVPRFLTALSNFQISSPYPVADLSDWFAAFFHLSVLIELGVLFLCALVCYGLVRFFLHQAKPHPNLFPFWLGLKGTDGVLFPLLLLALVQITRAVLFSFKVKPLLLTLSFSVLVILLVLRSIANVLLRVFPNARWTLLVKGLVGWVAWIGGILWVVGLLPAVWVELDDLTWTMGKSTVSLAMFLQGLFVALAVLLFMLWLSSLIDRRLLRDAPQGAELSLRKAISNASRALLIFIGVLVAFSSVGIDLTALSVLGGAVGVGIGLGLQRIAANYVSGFVILTERSMRIGDVIRVIGVVEGVITQINTRYTIIRASNGRETIVPNDTLISNNIENLTLSNPWIQSAITLVIPYAADIELARTLMAGVATDHVLVCPSPAPSVSVTALEDLGVRLTLFFWYSAANGASAPTTDLNLGILSAFKTAGIDVACPQRAVHMVS